VITLSQGGQTMKKIHLPLALILLLTACAPAQPSPTLTPVPPTVTLTAVATSTYEPTATSTPTSEPTATVTADPATTPTETLTVEPTKEVKVERICKWDNLTACKITLEEITNGQALEKDKAIVKQLKMDDFPPETMAIGDQFTIRSSGMDRHLWYNMNGDFYNAFINNPKKRPYRYIPSYSELIDPVIFKSLKWKVAVFTQQWLNPSGKISYLHYGINEVTSFSARQWLFHDMHFGFPTIWTDPSSHPEWYDEFNNIFHNEAIQSLINDWIETGEIPDELQYKLLSPIIFSPKME
jgi:hypothetical protein